MFCFFFFSSRRRHTRSYGDWSSDVCSSDLDRDGSFAIALRRRSTKRWTFVKTRANRKEPSRSVWWETARNCFPKLRSEERRVGKECRSGWVRCPLTEKVDRVTI